MNVMPAPMTRCRILARPERMSGWLWVRERSSFPVLRVFSSSQRTFWLFGDKPAL
jgi:hypothetical protein